MRSAAARARATREPGCDMVTSSPSVPPAEAEGKGRRRSGVSFRRDGHRASRLRALGDAMARDLEGNVLPFWAREAVDEEHGGFLGFLSEDGRARPARPQGRRPVRAHPLDVLRRAAPHRGPGPPADGRPRVRRAAGALLGRRARRDLLDARRLRAAALRPQADLRAGLQPLRPGRVPPGHGERRRRSSGRSRSTGRSRPTPRTPRTAATGRPARGTGARSRTCASARRT